MVKGFECRVWDFGFGLEVNGEIQGSGRGVCASSGLWEFIKALNREVKRQELYFSKMWPGQGSGGCPRWRRLLALEDDARTVVGEARGSCVTDYMQALRSWSGAGVDTPSHHFWGFSPWCKGEEILVKNQGTSSQTSLASPACPGCVIFVIFGRPLNLLRPQFPHF